jgi:hypothetical protein
MSEKALKNITPDDIVRMAIACAKEQGWKDITPGNCEIIPILPDNSPKAEIGLGSNPPNLPTTIWEVYITPPASQNPQGVILHIRVEYNQGLVADFIGPI